jgi:aspartate aminotransferase-like enzyme
VKEKTLFLPGPTPVPPQVLRAMSAPLIGHRNKNFSALFERVQEGLRYVFQTENEVITYPAAGTGAMEAAIVNLLSPGDRILVAVMGAFGERFVDIATAFGAEVETIEVQWGQAPDPEIIAERLRADKNGRIKAVFVTHNETSTGVTLDLKGVAAAVASHPALLVVDAVSSLGGIELRMDEWEIDVVVTGSQKALMLPPGLSFCAVGPKAWEAVEKARMPKFYWDFRSYRKSAQRGQTPYTPAVSLWFGLAEALEMIQNEGLEAIQQRHNVMGRMTRAGAKALGLKLLAAEDVASDTVTAVVAPEGIAPSDIRRIMMERYRMELAGGQKQLKDTVFRIGHLGYVTPPDVLTCLAALECTLAELDFPVELGAAVQAARQEFI